MNQGTSRVGVPKAGQNKKSHASVPLNSSVAVLIALCVSGRCDIALSRVDTNRSRFGLKNIKSFDKVNLSIKKAKSRVSAMACS